MNKLLDAGEQYFRKLSSIEKFLVIAILILLIAIAIVFAGCSRALSDHRPSKMQEITIEEARAEIEKLSYGLVVYYDDMKDAMIYRCDGRANDILYFVPYVEVNSNFQPMLGLQVFHVSRQPIFFRKLYIRSASKAYAFELSGNVNTDEYKGKMSDDIHAALEEAVESEYVKVRLEGRYQDERELTAEEIAQISEVLSIYKYFNQVRIKK